MIRLVQACGPTLLGLEAAAGFRPSTAAMEASFLFWFSPSFISFFLFWFQSVYERLISPVYVFVNEPIAIIVLQELFLLLSLIATGRMGNRLNCTFCLLVFEIYKWFELYVMYNHSSFCRTILIQEIYSNLSYRAICWHHVLNWKIQTPYTQRHKIDGISDHGNVIVWLVTCGAVNSLLWAQFRK